MKHYHSIPKKTFFLCVKLEITLNGKHLCATYLYYSALSTVAMKAGDTQMVLLIRANEWCLWIQWGQAAVESTEIIIDLIMQPPLWFNWRQKANKTCAHMQWGGLSKN